MLQTRKLRSLTDAQYSKNYTRITYEIHPVAGMTTDLSKSYLALRMYIVNDANITELLTKADYATLLSQGLMISFGQNGQSYTPACLFKVARLYDGNNNILEEVLFQNVLRATLAQICGDIETVSGNTLASSTGISMNPNGSLASQITNLLLNPTAGGTDMQPLEVHVELHELFGVCKNTNFHLEMTNGLTVELELEDRKSLLEVIAVGNPITIPPSNTGQFKYSPEMNPWSVLPVGQGDMGQKSYKYANAVMGGNGLHFDYTNIEGTWLTTADNNVVTLTGTYTAGDLSNVNITIGSMVKLNFSWTDPNQTNPTQQDKIVSVWSQITAVTASATVDESTFTIADKIQQPAPVYGVDPNMILDSFDVYVSDVTGAPANSSITGANYEALYLTPNASAGVYIDDADWSTFINTSQLTVNNITVVQMSEMGVINAIDSGNGTVRYVAGTVPFDLVINKSVDDVPITPWVDQFVGADSPTQRSIYASQSKVIPIQGGGAQIASVVGPTGGNYIITFTNLGLANNNSIQNGTILKTNTGYNGLIINNGTIVNSNPAEINTSFLICKHRNGVAPPIPILNATTTNSQLVVGQQYMINTLGTTTNAQWQSLGLSPSTGTPTVASTGMLFTVPLGAPTTGLGTGTVFQYSKYTTQPLSFMIDKCELVLVESQIDPSLPMSMIYSTYKCEVATIETSSLEIYNRQFIVTEPNVMNCYLICPQYNASADGKLPESLIGYSRNVNQYRWSVNNIEQTNRNVVVQSNTSKYPSSLHIAMLMDTFENSELTEKSISGLLTVPRSVNPPVVFPLRVYQGMDDMNHYMKPTGFTAQIQFYGDAIHSQNIIQGNIFFFKEMLKVLPVSQRM